MSRKYVGVVMFVLLTGSGGMLCAAGLDSPQVEIRLANGAIVLDSAELFESAELRVAGPFGYQARKSFARGDLVSVDLLHDGRLGDLAENSGDQPESLADGRYRFELVMLDATGEVTASKSDVFMVVNGITMSRDQFRAQLTSIRGDLNTGDRGRAESAGPVGDTPQPGDHQIVGVTSAAGSETDQFTVTDFPDDGTTLLSLDSDSPVSDQYWHIVHALGDLQFVEDSNFTLPGTRTFMHFDRTSDYVGLGTTTPAGSVHIFANNAPELILEDNGGAQWEIEASGSQLRILDDNDTRKFVIEDGSGSNQLVLDSTGNVGINTSSPDDPLHIVSAGTPTNGQLYVENTGPATTREMLSFSNAGRGQMTFENRATGETWQFINRFGSFWFSDLGDGPELDVQTDGDIGLGCRDPLSNIHVGKGTCGSGVWSQLQAGASQFTVSSSRTLKENLTPVAVPGLLDRIEQVDVYQYDFKEGPKDQLGVMAEDFHEIFGRGSDKQLNGHELQMALWMAVQELTSENRQLQERLLALEERVSGDLP